jgi:tetratricopeptide (TPR) repeat protein
MKKLMVALGTTAFMALSVPVMAQQSRPIPAEASQAMKDATLMLEQVRASNLDRWWRANAIARLARTQGRVGDLEIVRTLGLDTVLVLREESQSTPPPPALSEAATFAIRAQAYADVREPQGTTEAVNEALRLVGPEPAVRAAVMPVAAQALVEIGNRDGAAQLALEGLKAAAQLPPGRDRLAALSTIAIVQGKLGDRDMAQATLAAVKESLPANAGLADKAAALAHIARAQAAGGDTNGARTSTRDAVKTYDLSVNETNVTMGQRVATLALISVAQAEAGDKGAGRQILRVARQTASSITGPYEKLLALVTLADASMIVER